MANQPVISSQKIREIILEQSKRANVGHIGSALSIADIIAALYGQILNIEKPDDPDRDRFILSKGHAALCLYAALFLRGWITEKDLDTYCADNSQLGVHPEHSLKGVDFSTGSLGQGLSAGIGMALGARMQKKNYRTFVLLSDAECNEGSVWEAIMFAAHHKISNFIAILDLNAQQAFGYTKDVINLDLIAEKFKAFGWDVYEIDGHDVKSITNIVDSLKTTDGPPHMLVAKTTFGQGVSYMKSQIKWHYWPMSDEEYNQALKEVQNPS